MRGGGGLCARDEHFEREKKEETQTIGPLTIQMTSKFRIVTTEKMIFFFFHFE